MIENLTNKDIGRWVAYVAQTECEIGRIKNYGLLDAWVVYKCDGKWWNKEESALLDIQRGGTFMDYTANKTPYSELYYIEPQTNCIECNGYAFTLKIQPYGEDAKPCICLLNCLNSLLVPVTRVVFNTYSNYEHI